MGTETQLHVCVSTAFQGFPTLNAEDIQGNIFKGTVSLATIFLVFGSRAEGGEESSRWQHRSHKSSTTEHPGDTHALLPDSNFINPHSFC